MAMLVITRGYILGARLLQQKRDPVPSSGENDVSFQLAPTHCKGVISIYVCMYVCNVMYVCMYVCM